MSDHGKENRAGSDAGALCLPRRAPRAVISMERHTRARAVRLNPLDVLVRREHSVQFLPEARRAVLWNRIPAGGITIGKLISAVPLDRHAVLHTIGALRRVNAVEIRRCPR